MSIFRAGDAVTVLRVNSRLRVEVNGELLYTEKGIVNLSARVVMVVPSLNALIVEIFDLINSPIPVMAQDVAFPKALPLSSYV